MLLGVLSELTAAGAASPANNRTGVWVAVPDAEAMGKIGLNPGYPLIDTGAYATTDVACGPGGDRCALGVHLSSLSAQVIPRPCR